jgi:hypothetical protein
MEATLEHRWKEVLPQYLRVTNRTLAQVLTTKLLYIASGAQKLTPRADKGDIMQDLGAGIKRLRVSKKTGMIKTIYKYDPVEMVYPLLVSWRKAHKKSPYQLPKAERRRAAERFIAKRMGSVGSLKAGWSRIIGKLAQAVKEMQNGESGLPRVKQAGKAVPAKESYDPVAYLSYRMASVRKGQFYIDPRVIEAARTSFSQEISSMEKYVRDKMTPDARKVGLLP